MDNPKVEDLPKIKKSILDRSIDFIFSNDERRWLILIFILGVILRFFVANNVSFLGDEMVHGPHIIGFLHSGLISTFAHSPLWFYLGDMVFKIFEVTAFSTRFLSFFYGSLSILLVYLITVKIFNIRVALLSSFLFSVSYFTIRYTLAEMDHSASFFLLFAIYFFITQNEKGKFPYLAAVCLGLASLIKTLSLFFVPAFLIAFLIFDFKRESKKEYFIKNIKKCLLFGLIVVLFFSPILIHNYLWYTDKGMVDVYFAQYFDIGNVRQAYAGQLGYDSGLLSSRFFEGTFKMLSYIFMMDPLIVILGIMGLVFLSFSIEKRKYLLLFIFFELFGFVLLILSNWLPTHYTTMMPVLCIFGGYGLSRIFDYVTRPFSGGGRKKITFFIIIAILLFQFFLVPVGTPVIEKTNLVNHLTSRCGAVQMRDYAVDKMDKNSLVIADSRIYRGRIAWLFNDFHYLESAYLSQLLEANKNMSGTDIAMNIYFVECAVDDCGWGTIKNQPDFNQSMENIVSLFSQIPVEKTLYGGGGYEEEKTTIPVYRVYKTQIPLKPQVLQIADSTHDWFYYPVNYLPKEKIFDRYSVNGFFDNLLYKLAWLILIISIVIALILPLVIFFKLFNNSQ